MFLRRNTLRRQNSNSTISAWREVNILVPDAAFANYYAEKIRIWGKIMSNRLSFIFVRTFVFSIALLSLASTLVTTAAAQEPEPVSPPIANPNDKRFKDVTEDWTTPSLSGSHLIPASPVDLVDDSHPGYTLELLQLQWRWGDPLDVYVLKPRGVKKPPVILNLYGFPTDTDPYKNEIFDTALTKNGFAAVGFVCALTGHRYHDRPMREWFVSDLQESLGTTAHDVQMVLYYLEARGDLDMNRVGMFGQGTGATIAILASAVDPRIKVLDVLDPWGDWPDWIATSPVVPEDERADYLKPEFLEKAATVETLDWLPKIQAKKFRMQQNTFETDTPTAIKAKLRAAVPPGTAFAFYKTIPEFKAAFPYSTNLEWMEHELRMLTVATSAARQPQ